MTTETQEVAEQSAPVELQDENQQVNAPEVTAAEGVAEEKQVEPPKKTFTQEEVDALVQKRLLREQRRITRELQDQLKQPQQEPRRETFADEEAYDKANLEYLAEKKAAEKLAKREQEQEQERRQEAFLEKAEKAAERYPDFQLVVSNPNLAINDAMYEFIAESEQGAEVAYFLGKNPMKAAAIAQMSPVKAARELVKLESELAARPKATPSRAPDPIKPVGARGALSSALPSDEDDIVTWMKKEEARTRKR